MRKLAFFLGLAIAIFVSAQVASATQIIDDVLQVNSLKVGKQGEGGVTFFNGTIINDTTTESGLGNPVTFGDDVRIDGRVHRGEVAGYYDPPFIINDNVQIEGSLEVMGQSIGIALLDTLGGISDHCSDGQIPYYNQSYDMWSCRDDDFENLNCSYDEIARSTFGGWKCDNSIDDIDSIIDFIDCVSSRSSNEDYISVRDWESCKLYL